MSDRFIYRLYSKNTRHTMRSNTVREVVSYQEAALALQLGVVPQQLACLRAGLIGKVQRRYLPQLKANSLAVYFKALILLWIQAAVHYIVGKVMIHGFYPNLISDLQPKKSNPLILLIQPWLFASILL